MKIIPSELSGIVQVPSSKSIGHRMLICAALAEGRSKISGISMSKDIIATIGVIEALGATILIEQSGNSEKVIWIDGISGIHEIAGTQGIAEIQGIAGTQGKHNAIHLNCNESGSTLRFMIPVGLAVADDLVFHGEGRLIDRPINEYFDIFDQCHIKMGYNGRLPLHVMGSLQAGEYELSGKVSSQYTTGMLLAAPRLDGATVIRINSEMESKGYLDLTIDCMKRFGVSVLRQGYQSFFISADAAYQAAEVQVEGDFSQAAFWVVAGIIGKQPIHIQGLNPETMQGDAAILKWVAEMGGIFEWEGSLLKALPSVTHGCVIDASQCPDLVPILCVMATQSHGETVIVNGQRLRVKESDRIKSTVSELTKMGAQIIETEDGMIIQGKSILMGGCLIDSWNDHRIVMAMTIASTVSSHPIEIEGSHAIEKSYPDFFADFVKLGGKIESK